MTAGRSDGLLAAAPTATRMLCDVAANPTPVAYDERPRNRYDGSRSGLWGCSFFRSEMEGRASVPPPIRAPDPAIRLGRDPPPEGGAARVPGRAVRSTSIRNLT